MKHLLYTIAALAAITLAASCTREQEGAINGEKAMVSFTVTAPGTATKGLSEGSFIDNLAVAVYDGATTPSYLEALSQAAVITGSAPTWNVSIPVVKNLAYSFVFFAKSSTDNGFYTFAPASKTLTVDYSKLATNSDAADAFFGKIDQTTITGDMALSVNLERPLAQVNVGAGDLANAALSLNLDGMTTALALTGINNVMNVLDGSLSGAATVTYNAAARVSENTAFTTGFDRIAMAYVLAGAKQNTDVTVTIAAGGQNFTVSVPNAPIQKNYRTNILGNFFTGNVNVTVNMTPGFLNVTNNVPEVPYYETLSALNSAYAANEGIGYQVAVTTPATGTITLPATTGDVRILLPGDWSANTVTLAYAANATASQKPANVYIAAPNLGTLSGDIQATHVEIESGSLINTGELHTSNSTLVIQKLAKIINLIIHHGSLKVEGEVTTAEVKETAVGASTVITPTAKVETLTVKAGSVEVQADQTNNTAAEVETLIIDNTSGTVEEVVINNDANVEDTQLLGGGITVQDETGDTTASSVAVSTEEEFKQAILHAQDGTTVVLMANLDFSKAALVEYKWAGSTYNPLEIVVDNFTLDLNNHTLSNMGNCGLAAGKILAADGRISNFTIKNGTLQAGQTNNVTNSYVLAIAGVDGALIKDVTTNGGINVYTGSTDVVIEDCTVNGTKYYSVCVQSGSHVTIKGGSEITKNTDSSVSTKAMFWIDKAGSDSDCATTENPNGAYGDSSIELLYGTYTVDATNGGVFYLSSGLAPVVKGGIFNFDPSAYVPDGYEVTDLNDGTYGVGAEGTIWGGGQNATGGPTPGSGPGLGGFGGNS